MEDGTAFKTALEAAPLVISLITLYRFDAWKAERGGKRRQITLSLSL